MGLARATYYHGPKHAERLLKSNMDLKEKIETIYLELPGYGYRRVHEQLLREGVTVNTKRIGRVNKKESVFSCIKSLIKQKGSGIGKRLVFPNFIEADA